MLGSPRVFQTRITPGEQANGLVFVMGIVLIEEGSRFLLRPGTLPLLTGEPITSALIVLGLFVILVTPVVIHLVATLETLGLMGVSKDRAGISETVQVIAFATAPCVFAGIPILEVRVLCTVYGAVLLITGTAVVHNLSRWRAFLASFLPAVIVFGYGFRGFAAIVGLLSKWFII